MKYLFVLNPKSGPAKRAGKIKELVKSRFRETDHQIEFAFTRGPGDATDLARQAVKDGFDIVVAAGGDGTVNEIAGGLVESHCSMGIIPLGSGNGVARSLGIPMGIKASIHTLLNPNIRLIDIGKINGEIFVGVAGTGFDARIGSLFQEFGVRPHSLFLNRFAGIQTLFGRNAGTDL